MSRHRILLADDDKLMQRLFCNFLGAHGYAVEYAGNGQEALEKIAQDRPDLVLLDLMMPVMDGWEVLERLRQVDDPPPVIVFSATPLEQLRGALDAGAVALLGKPFPLGALLEACRKALGEA